MEKKCWKSENFVSPEKWEPCLYYFLTEYMCNKIDNINLMPHRGIWFDLLLYIIPNKKKEKQMGLESEAM